MKKPRAAALRRRFNNLDKDWPIREQPAHGRREHKTSR